MDAGQPQHPAGARVRRSFCRDGTDGKRPSLRMVLVSHLHGCRPDGLDDLLVSAGYSHDMQDLDTLEKIAASAPLVASDEASLQAAFTQEMQEHIALYPPLREPVTAFRGSWQGSIRRGDRSGNPHPAVHQGFATADLDADGDLDLVLNRFNDTPAFYRNQASGARLSLSLIGKGPNTAPWGRGWAMEAASMQRTVIAGGRYLSHGESKQVFAMPNAQAIASLRIRWPDGSQSVHDSPWLSSTTSFSSQRFRNCQQEGCLNHRLAPTHNRGLDARMAESRLKALLANTSPCNQFALFPGAGGTGLQVWTSIVMGARTSFWGSEGREDQHVLNRPTSMVNRV